MHSRLPSSSNSMKLLTSILLPTSRLIVKIYKGIRLSLEDADGLSFHLKNKGITILAHRVEYSQGKFTATIHLGQNDGALHPMLGSLRYLIEQKDGENVYS